MESEKLRVLASDFLERHGHPGYAQVIKQRCAFRVIEPLLKRYGRKELFRLYECMSKDLRQGLLYWFAIGGTTGRKLGKKLLEIDGEHKRIRNDWVRWCCKDLLAAEVEAYFRKLEAVILAWLKGRKK